MAINYKELQEAIEKMKRTPRYRFACLLSWLSAHGFVSRKTAQWIYKKFIIKSAKYWQNFSKYAI